MRIYSCEARNYDRYDNNGCCLRATPFESVWQPDADKTLACDCDQQPRWALGAKVHREDMQLAAGHWQLPDVNVEQILDPLAEEAGVEDEQVWERQCAQVGRRRGMPTLMAQQHDDR